MTNQNDSVWQSARGMPRFDGRAVEEVHHVGSRAAAERRAGGHRDTQGGAGTGNPAALQASAAGAAQIYEPRRIGVFPRWR